MNSVAGGALEKPEKREEVCPMKQRQNFTGIKGKNHEHLQEYQQGVRRLLSEVEQEVQVEVQEVAGREEVENFETNCLSLLLKDQYPRDEEC